MANQIDNLKEICQQIGKALALEIDRSNGDEVAGKLQQLTTLLATSSHAVALAESLYAEKIMQLAEDNKYTGFSATDKKMIFGGRAKSEVYYVTLTTRQNSSLVHSIDALRSMLSYIKEEMSRLQT